MPPLSTLAAGSIIAALLLYSLTGGADFGGGFWDLLARGPRAGEQRKLVVRAIGPIWETNHIWLVVAVVVLFTAFPRAFAVISTALFLPLTLVLVGIVLRGAAFAFHSHEFHAAAGRGRWETVFAGASLMTPLLLGIAAGAISTGGIKARGMPNIAAPSVWLAAFPVAIGLFTLALYCYLAAVYLIFETPDDDLREDFRIRAIWSARAVIALAFVVPVMAGTSAPDFQDSLLEGRWSASVLLMAATGALGAYVSLHFRTFWLARVCAVVQVSFIVLGWGLAQFPYLVRPDVTTASSASFDTIRVLLIALAAGAAVLFPCVAALFILFKKEALTKRPRDTRP